MSILRGQLGIRRLGYAVVVLSLVVATAACNKTVDPPVFDAQRAFADLEHQVAFGPRVPGSDAHAACAAWLEDTLSRLADSVYVQRLSRFVPLMNDTVPLMNIVAHFGSDHARRIGLVAHWDSRAYADIDPDSANWTKPVPGANDGASGVAVLLECARLFAESPPPIGVDIVLVDGEDQGRYRNQNEWAVGSAEYVAQMKPSYEWGILVDMVGERGAEFRREGYSRKHAGPLLDKVWGTAAALGETRFLNDLEEDVTDDHVPFLMRGIPMVDIIDLRYPYWHTVEDTPDKCDPASLQSVGRVILHLIYSE